MIAGIIRAPAAYSPWTHFDAARRRSFVVLQRMREEKKITPAQEQAARVAMDPNSGNLFALVGGSDFSVTPYNRAVRSKRQPGSAFKPFVYSVALERGMSPVSTLSGLKQVAIQASEGTWIPRDERPSDQDSMTLREALLES